MYVNVNVKFIQILRVNIHVHPILQVISKSFHHPIPSHTIPHPPGLNIQAQLQQRSIHGSRHQLHGLRRPLGHRGSGEVGGADPRDLHHLRCALRRAAGELRLQEAQRTPGSTAQEVARRKWKQKANLEIFEMVKNGEEWWRGNGNHGGVLIVVQGGNWWWCSDAWWWAQQYTKTSKFHTLTKLPSSAQPIQDQKVDYFYHFWTRVMHCDAMLWNMEEEQTKTVARYVTWYVARRFILHHDRFQQQHHTKST